MNEVFLVFLSLSLSGAFLALLLFLLKPFYKDRLSKTWQYYILLIVILRLLVPFGRETSLVGMIFERAGNYGDTGDIPSVYTPDSHYASQALPLETSPMPENNAFNIEPLRNAGDVAMDLMWLGWLAPAIFLMFRKVIGYRRSVGAIKARSIVIDHAHVLDVYREVCEAMKIKRPPALTENKSVAAPMLVGTVRPMIVLPDICLKDKELRYVFKHELTHYKRLDIIYKWLAQITVCLHWFNPFAYRICREIDRNCELSCDEAVIRRLDEADKYAYGDMLLETIKLNVKTPIPVVSVTLNEDTKLIKERLSAIMKFGKISKISMATTLLLTVFFLCGAVYTGVYAKSNEEVSLNKDPENIQTVVYEDVEMRRYEQSMGSFKAHPYIHDVKTNHTDKTIVGYQCGMLAFDKDGKPLMIDWFSMDDEQESTFFYLFLIDGDIIKLQPGETYDVFGGWSLNIDGNDPVANEIAYVLYCDKEITFEDGTVWKNPDFDQWLNTYEGKTVDVQILEDYYPYVQEMDFK